MEVNQIIKFFQTKPDFKAWIENTSLFHALKADRGGVIRLHAEDGDIDGEIFRNHIIIEKAEDLPIEMIQQFYINSPWYDNTSTEINLIDYEHSNKRIENG